MTIFRKIHVYTTPSLYKQQIHILHSSFTEYSSFVMHKFSSFWCLCSSGYVYTPSQEYFPCYLSSFPVIHFCHLVRFLMHTTFACRQPASTRNIIICYAIVMCYILPVDSDGDISNKEFAIVGSSAFYWRVFSCCCCYWCRRRVSLGFFLLLAYYYLHWQNLFCWWKKDIYGLSLT